MIRYHCGANGCQGHLSVTEKCKEQYYYCSQDCPVHFFHIKNAQKNYFRVITLNFVSKQKELVNLMTIYTIVDNLIAQGI